MPRVVKAKEPDLRFIMRWLEEEYREHDEGFWRNRNMIADAFYEDKELWVVRINNEAVAFQVGRYSPVIVSVREEFKGTGLGAALFKASLKRAERDGINLLRGECAPYSSVGFWRRMGFKGISNDDDRFRYRLVDRQFDLPDGANRFDVHVDFFQEAAAYSKDVDPFESHLVCGALSEDGKSVQLARRVVGFSREHGDLVVRIAVADDVLCCCKAKYPEAQEVGVEKHPSDGTFFIDAVRLRRTNGA